MNRKIMGGIIIHSIKGIKILSAFDSPLQDFKYFFI